MEVDVQEALPLDMQLLSMDELLSSVATLAAAFLTTNGESIQYLTPCVQHKPMSVALSKMQTLHLDQNRTVHDMTVSSHHKYTYYHDVSNEDLPLELKTTREIGECMVGGCSHCDA